MHLAKNLCPARRAAGWRGVAERVPGSASGRPHVRFVDGFCGQGCLGTTQVSRVPPAPLRACGNRTRAVVLASLAQGPARAPAPLLPFAGCHAASLWRELHSAEDWNHSGRCNMRMFLNQ